MENINGKVKTVAKKSIVEIKKEPNLMASLTLQ